MATFALESLVRRAASELGSEACADGRHQWVSVGGRSCPKELDTCCSQAVYECMSAGPAAIPTTANEAGLDIETASPTANAPLTPPNAHCAGD
jgi:hypothetical protein